MIRVMPSSQSDPRPRWREMQDAIRRACERPVAVMEVVATSSTRANAAAALATLLEVDLDLSDQLLDLNVSNFIAGSTHN
jgi:hypothetical protein